MIGKLLKYEFKYLVRDFTRTYLIYAGLLLSVILLYHMAGAGRSSGGSFIYLLFSACATAYVIYTVVLVFITVAHNVRRFRKNMFSQEGYLTNTLPVTPEQHIIAKVIAGAANCIVSYLVIFFGLWMLFAGFGMGDAVFSLFQSLLRLFEIRFIIPSFLSSTTSFLAILLCCYLAVSFSSMIGGSKGKSVLLVIGGFIAYTVIISMISASIEEPIRYLSTYEDYIEASYRATAMRMYVMTIVNTAIAAAEFFGIVYIIKNKLNLQ